MAAALLLLFVGSGPGCTTADDRGTSPELGTEQQADWNYPCAEANDCWQYWPYNQCTEVAHCVDIRNGTGHCEWSMPLAGQPCHMPDYTAEPCGVPGWGHCTQSGECSLAPPPVPGTYCCSPDFVTQGTCNGTQQCVDTGMQQRPSETYDLNFYLTDAAINKELYEQFHSDGCKVGSIYCRDFVSPGGVGYSVVACVPTAGATVQEAAQCLATNVVGSPPVCPSTRCSPQTLAFSLRMDQPKVYFEAGFIKVRMQVYLNVAPPFDKYSRVLYWNPSIAFHPTVSTADLRKFLNDTYDMITQLLQLYENMVPRDVKEIIAAQFGDPTEFTRSGITPLALEMYGRRQLMDFIRYTPDAYGTVSLRDLTLSATVENGRLRVTVTPKTTWCFLTPKWPLQPPN